MLLFLIGLVLLAFKLLAKIAINLPKAARFLKKLLVWGLCITLLASLTTGIWIGSMAKGNEEFKSNYVIVLGAGVNGNVPSRPLRERLEAAKAYLEEHPQAVAVLTGGQGSHENISEAQCMYNWLTEKGISPDRLRMEDKATSTEENLRFSLDLIEEETGNRPETATVISNEYHLARATLYAQNEGIEAEVYCAELNFSKLFELTLPEPTFTPLPKYPAVTRDLALVCDEAITVAELENCITAAGGKLLRQVNLFDIYRGKGIPEGKKSMAFSLVLRADDRTLTDEDSVGVVNKVLAKLESDLGVQIR